MESYASPPWGSITYVSNLEFLCTDLFLVPYLFILSFIYITMDSWIFILYFGVISNNTLFNLQILPPLTIGSSFRLAPVFFWHTYLWQTYICLLFLLVLLYFLALEDPISSSFIFPWTSSRISHFSKDP